jgi:UDP-3-O-acyl-N-acetylglucosamine deacetylase
LDEIHIRISYSQSNKRVLRRRRTVTVTFGINITSVPVKVDENELHVWNGNAVYFISIIASRIENTTIYKMFL